MLTIERCRELLGENVDPDQDVETLRDTMYELAEGLVRVYLAEPPLDHREADEDRFHDLLPELAPDVAEDVVERAAIMEIDGGLPRDVAERESMFRVLSCAVDEKGTT